MGIAAQSCFVDSSIRFPWATRDQYMASVLVDRGDAFILIYHTACVQSENSHRK